MGWPILSDRSPRYLPGCLALAAGFLAITGCGLPKLADIPTEWKKHVEQLGGLKAVYPPRESMRLGQLWISDVSADPAHPNARVLPHHTTRLWLSDALVPEMEAARARQAASARFAKSPATLAADLGLASASAARQSAEDTLEVTALPKYSLATVDQATVAAAVPAALASFFAAFGFAQSNALTLSALGVEIAELPLQPFADVIRNACRDDSGALRPGPARDGLQSIGYNALGSAWKQRQADAHGAMIDAYQPNLLVLRRVFYMRGISYLFSDRRASAAAANVAFNPRLPATAPPASSPAIPPPVFATPPSAAGVAELTAATNALTAQLVGMHSALTAANGAAVATSFARATAQGIEMVELFDRPVAFGYDAYEETMKRATDGSVLGGIDALCADFDARTAQEFN